MLKVGRLIIPIILLILFGQSLLAQQTYIPYPGAEPRPDYFSASLSTTFTCGLPIDPSQPFFIEESFSSNLLQTVDFATPIIGDITGDGYPEILVLRKPAQDYGIMYGVRRTKDILVYSLKSGALQQIGLIETPFVVMEGPTPFAIAKVDGGLPLIIVAASHDLDNIPSNPLGISFDQDFKSKLVAYRFNGSGFTREWISNQTYGRNVPLSVKPFVFPCFYPNSGPRSLLSQCGGPGATFENIPPPGINYHFRSGAAPGIADFNGDGIAEVYIYNEIFDATNGQFIADGGNNGQGVSQITPGNGNLVNGEFYGGTSAVSVAADLDNDGLLELAAGKTIYKVNISSKTLTPINVPSQAGFDNIDGYTSIADINLDGKLDVIVTTSKLKSTLPGNDNHVPNSRQVYIWGLNSSSGNLITHTRIPDENGFGTNIFMSNDVAISMAFVGDIDGDEKPDIGFTTGRRLWMLKYDGSNLINFSSSWPLTTNDRSGSTLITMFDFNQDGKQELVYRDETNLRILSANGSTLASFQSFSLTAAEGAVVADVDLDGEVEILVTSAINTSNFLNNNREANLKIYKAGSGTRWAPSRSVWNQYAYFSFNVEDDLSIPKPQRNHASTLTELNLVPLSTAGCPNLPSSRFYNSFLAQPSRINQEGCFAGAVFMDAVVEIIGLPKFYCDASGQGVRMDLIIKNVSTADPTDNVAALFPDTKIKFTVGLIENTLTLEDLGILNRIRPGESITINDFKLDGVSDDLTGTQEIEVNINFDVSKYECETSNNLAKLTITPFAQYDFSSETLCFGAPDPNDISLTKPNTFVLTPIKSDPNSLEDLSSLRWLQDGIPINSSTIGGVIYNIDPTTFELTVTGLPAKAVPYKFRLENSCTGWFKEVDVVINPNPTASFSVTDVLCFGQQTGKISIQNNPLNIQYQFSLDQITFYNETDFEALNLIANNYVITVRNIITNCITQYPITITQPAELKISNTLRKDPVCQPDNGSFTWLSEGGPAGAAFVYEFYKGGVLQSVTIEDNLDIPGNKIIKNLTGGTYRLVLKDANNCVTEANFALLNQVNPQFTFTAPFEACFGDKPMFQVDMVNLGVPAADPTYVWEVKDASGNFVTATDGATINDAKILIELHGAVMSRLFLENATAGKTYEVRVTPTGTNTCSAPPMNASVKVNPLPKVTHLVSDVSCFGGKDGKITFTKDPSVTSENYEYTLGGVTNTTGVFVDLVADFYSVTIKNTATNCFIVVSNIEVKQPPQMTFTKTLENPSCGQNNGVIKFTIGGGTPGDYQLEITSSSLPSGKITQTYTAVGNYEIKDLPVGTYNVSLKDKNSCLLTDTFTMLNDPKGIINLAVVDVDICQGNVANFIPIINVDKAAPTVKWFKDAAKTQLITPGTDTDGVSYTLTGSQLSITGLTAAMTGRKYWIEVDGPDYCSEVTKEVKVNVIPLVTATLSNPPIACFGEKTLVTVAAAGGNGSYTYSINGTNYQAGNVFDLGAGSHKIYVKSADCQVLEIPFTLSQPVELKVNKVSEVIPACGTSNGEYVFKVEGGVAPYSIKVNGNALSSVPHTVSGTEYKLTGLALNTSYFVEVQDANNCGPKLFEVKLLDTSAINVVSANLQKDICEGNKLEFVPNLTLTGVTPPLNFKWYRTAARATADEIVDNYSPTGTGVMFEIDPGTGKLTVHNLTAGTYTYYLTVSNAGNTFCPANSQARGVVTDIPNPVFKIIDVLCFGDTSGSFEITSGSDPSLTFSIGTDPTRLSLTQFLNKKFPAGIHKIFTYKGTSDCPNIQDLQILQPVAALDFSNFAKLDPTCGSANGRIEFEITGGKAPYQVTLNGLPFTGAISLNVFTLTNNIPGNYTFKVKDANGCEATKDVLLVNQSLPLVPVAPILEVACQGAPVVFTPKYNVSSLPASANPTFRWFLDATLTTEILSNYVSGGSGVMFDISPSGVLTVYNLAVGNHNYHYQMSDPTAICTVSSSATVRVNPEITATVNFSDKICFGASNGTINVTGVSGGTGTFEYKLERIGSSTPISNWGSTRNFSNLSAGDYEVAIRDIGGACEITKTVTIAAPAAALDISGTMTEASCNAPNGAISVSVTGGWTPYSFEWRRGSPTGVVVSGGSITGLNNLVPDKYYLIVKDSINCSITKEFDLKTIPVPDFSHNPIAKYCESPLISLEVTNTVSLSTNSTYEWQIKNGTTQTPLIDGQTIAGVTYKYREVLNKRFLDIENLPAGNYTFVYKDNCSNQALEFAFEVQAAPNPTFDPINISCFGSADGKIRLVGTTPSDWKFSVNGGSFISRSALEALNLAAGTYTITTENGIGCSTVSSSITLGKTPLNITIIRKEDSPCNSNTGLLEVGLAGGTAPYQLILRRSGTTTPVATVTSSASSHVFNNLTPGDYTVELRDVDRSRNASCFVVTTTQKIENSPTQIIVADQEFCRGDIIELKPLINPVSTNPINYSYYWGSISPTNLITHNKTIGTLPNQIRFELIGGNLKISGLDESLTHKIWVTVSGTGICSGFEKEVTLKGNLAPVFSVSTTDIACFGDTGTITINPPAGMSGVTYQLTTVGGAATGAFISYPGNSITGLAKGKYSISAKNAAGCLWTHPDIEILGADAALSLVDVAASKPDLCNQSDGEIKGEVKGGRGTYTIRLFKGTSAIATQTLSTAGVFTFIGLSVGNDYRVEAQDSFCATPISQSAISVSAATFEIFVSDLEICNGTSGTIPPPTLSVSTPAGTIPTFQWFYENQTTTLSNGGSPDTFGATYQIMSDGSLRIFNLPPRAMPYVYWVKATGVPSCGPSMKRVEVRVVNPPNLKVVNPSLVCDPSMTVDLRDFVLAYDVTNFDYEFEDASGNVLSASQFSRISSTGIYTVKAKEKGSSCFSGQELLNVVITTQKLEPEFFATIGGNVISSFDEIFTFDPIQFTDFSRGNSIQKWEWDFGDGTKSTLQNPTHVYKKPGNYQVKLNVIDQVGCTDVFLSTITVGSSYEIVLPDALFPESADFRDQQFKVYTKGVASVNMMVFNKWGELIFVSDDKDRGWNGYFKSYPAPNGNYVYKITAITGNGEKIEKAGVFLLIR